MDKKEAFKRKAKKYWEKNKVKIIATAILFGVAIVLFFIPFFASSKPNEIERNQDATTKKLQNLFDREQVQSIEQAKELIERNQIDVSDLDDGANYAWNSTSGMVYLRRGSIEFDREISSFDYMMGEVTMGYRIDYADCYLLNAPETIAQDLASIYEIKYHPEQTISFISSGVYLDFVEFAYHNTLFVNQVSSYGFTTYLGDEATSTSSCMTVILGDVDADQINPSYLDISIELLRSQILDTKEIIFTRRTNSVSADLVQSLYGLERFVLDGCTAFQLEGYALIKDGALVAYPCKTGESEIVVSNQIQRIERGAFSGVSVTKITLPFVGASRGTSSFDFGLFGYIFGKTKTGVDQVMDSVLYTFNIPNTLRDIIITDETKICSGAFSGLTFIESIALNEGITCIEDRAFDRCNSIQKLVLPSSVFDFTIGNDTVMSALVYLSLPNDFDLHGFGSFTKKEQVGDRFIYTK